MEVKREKGSQWSFSALGFKTSYMAMADFTPRDNLSLSLMYQHSKEDDWLNWIEDNLLGIYKQKQRTTNKLVKTHSMIHLSRRLRQPM